MRRSAPIPSPSDGVFLRREFTTGIPVVHVNGVSEPRYRTPMFASLLVLFFMCAWKVLARLRNWLLLRKRYRRPKLNADIAEFYDARSKAWEEVWGDHMHHGLYHGPMGRRDRPLRGREAQIETMEELLRLGSLGQDSAATRALREKSSIAILDVGCGVGGASRFLAGKFPNARVTGITLSSVQATRANQLNDELGLANRVYNVVLDALDTDFPDDTFDVIWSMESAEHIPDKHAFVSELFRILKPGGHLVVLAWCLRESNPRLKLSERASIRRIMTEYCLPRLAPASEYCNLMRRLGFRKINQDDWTERAAPFWGEVVRTSFFNVRGWQTLAKYGMPLVRSALAVRHVISAIRQGCFRLVAFSAIKPTLREAEVEKEKMIALRSGC